MRVQDGLTVADAARQRTIRRYAELVRAGDGNEADRLALL
jgi:hypothetical protein